MLKFTKSYSRHLTALTSCYNRLRTYTVSGFWVSLLLLVSQAAFSQAANLDQGENGSATSPKTIFWQNGNLGPSGAHFAEGYSIPYRCFVSSLTGNAATIHTLVIEWDTKDQNGHALDYITHYYNLDNPVNSHQSNFSHGPEAVNPTTGTGFILDDSLEYQIPTPSSTGAEVTGMPGQSFTDLPTANRTNRSNATKMAIWGGTIIDFLYLREDNQDATTASTKTQLRIRFTSANASTALLAWGGHIAAEYDWGVGRGASEVNGSPYHMRIVSIDGKPGGQDRSLKASSVLVPTVGCTLSAAQTACQGTSAGLTYSYTGSTVGITNYSWTLTPSTTNATIQNGTTTTTLSGANVTSITIVPGSGQTFAPGTFTVSLTVANLGGAGTPCTQTGTINPAATVNAGPDQTVCASSPQVTLAGSVGGGATSGTWSGGTGTFDPNNTTLNTKYTPSQAEIDAGTVTLTLTTNNPTGPCEAVSETMVINITANPARPAVDYLPPACDEFNFRIRINNPVAGGTYTLTQIIDPNDLTKNVVITKTTAADKDPNGNFILITGLTIGKGFSIVVKVGDCTSAATDCTNFDTPLAPLTLDEASRAVETVTAKIEPKQSTVLAAPNPFSSRVKFSLQSAVSGQGSLELFNMLGQKVKTVYQGYVKEGQTLNVEYAVPMAQRTNLMYVFRVGDQQVTGKLISVK